MITRVRRLIGRSVAAWDAGVARWRARSAALDHLWRARERYNENFGPRLAAAIAYYGFFAAFALGLVAYSVLGFVLAANHSVLRSVNQFLARNLPFLNATDIANARRTVAVLSLIGLVLTGVGWVDGMRSAQRAMWRLEQQPGNFFIRRVVDLAMLVGLGLLLSLSLWAAGGIESLGRDVLGMLADERAASGVQDAAARALDWLGQVLSVLVNLVLAAGLLVAVPRLRVSVRRMLPSVVLVGLGVTLLSTVGRIYVSHTEHNPAYRIVGTTAGLLVFLNLFSQLLLFGAALAATGTRGPVTDLAAGPPPAGAEPPAEAEPPAGAEPPAPPTE